MRLRIAFLFIIAVLPLLKAFHQPLDEFMMTRSVRIRPWGEQILQVYRGMNVTSFEQGDPRFPACRCEADALFHELSNLMGASIDSAVPSSASRATGFASNVDDEFALFESIIDRFNISFSARQRLKQWQDLSFTSRIQLRQKLEAELRASARLDPAQHLRILYHDSHICVVNKPSGILAVPGIKRKPSLLGLIYDALQPDTVTCMDQMVVHRLDMDTSGVMVFALTLEALRQLHDDFRDRRVYKEYEAVIAGHIRYPEAEIELDLERDKEHPPFMTISKPSVDNSVVNGNIKGPKFLNQAPKASFTELRLLQRFLWNGLPVTRVGLVPHTGRTHQLRVHMAALGHPIVGDDIYGYGGEGCCGITATPESTSLHQKIWQSIDHPLCLHAKRLSFRHPVSKHPLLFECDAPFFKFA